MALDTQEDIGEIICTTGSEHYNNCHNTSKANKECQFQSGPTIKEQNWQSKKQAPILPKPDSVLLPVIMTKATSMINKAIPQIKEAT